MEDQKSIFSDFSTGLVDRRSFLKSLFVITGGLSLSGCLTYFYEETKSPSPINDLQLQNLRATQNHLFPKSPSNPSADDINSLEFLQFVLLDKQLEEEEREFLINGANWINDSSQENFQLDFFELDQASKEKLFEIISQKNWGENWLSAILKYIFEALLSDPIYGANPDSIGWNWLQIQPGYPRPSELTAYPRILKI